ncbi:FAD binding domain-containing protein, partial [Lentinula detonsa]
IFLADAAHVHSPTGGQGLNSGIQDAFNLCWKLSLVHKGLQDGSINSNRLMYTYTEERVRVVKAMLTITTNLLKRTFGANPGGKPSRSGIAFIRGFELCMFGINYRGSPIVLDEVDPPAEVLDPYNMSADEPVRGGDHAPQAVGLKVLCGLSFTSTAHTALVFAGSIESLELVRSLVRALTKYPHGMMRIMIVHSPEGEPELVLEVQDTEGHAYASYLRGLDQSGLPASGSERKGLVVVIVRADGHVGAIVKDAEGGDRYKQKLFA